MKFFIDVDDTLSNFKDHAVASGVPPWTGTWYATNPATWTPEQHEIQRKTNETMENPDFWLTMPVMPGAFEIIAACASRADTYLLTAYPGPCRDKGMVRSCKVEWAHRKLHFPSPRVIVCERPEKVRHAFNSAGNTSNWLIDDAEKNCHEWRGANGFAILSDFHNGVTVESVLEKIKDIA